MCVLANPFLPMCIQSLFRPTGTLASSSFAVGVILVAIAMFMLREYKAASLSDRVVQTSASVLAAALEASRQKAPGEQADVFTGISPLGAVGKCTLMYVSCECATDATGMRAVL